MPNCRPKLFTVIYYERFILGLKPIGLYNDTLIIIDAEKVVGAQQSRQTWELKLKMKTGRGHIGKITRSTGGHTKRPHEWYKYNEV